MDLVEFYLERVAIVEIEGKKQRDEAAVIANNEVARIATNNRLVFPQKVRDLVRSDLMSKESGESRRP